MAIYEIYDIECYFEEFLYVGYNVKTGKWVDFEISMERNDLFAFVKYILDGERDYLVGFNNINYDMQIVQHIIDNHQRWAEMDLQWDEIVLQIYRFSNRTIDDIKHDLRPTYWESQFSVVNIDLSKIHHFDNENKRVSLKWLEFMLDLEDIEVMPVDFRKVGLTKEDIALVKHYCYNDVKATYMFYLLTIGETDNEFYKGKNKIQDRFDVMDEFGFGIQCLNWSDVKIGDEINLKGYMEKTKKSRKDIYELKKKRGPTKKFTFGDCIPNYVTFETKEFKDFYNSIRKIQVRLTSDSDTKKKQEYPFTYRGTTYTIARGGIHSTEKKRIVIPNEDETCKDADVGSQYPNALKKRKLFPRHLGTTWNENFAGNIEMRLSWKKKGKTDKRYKGLAEMMKLALNGGGFGKTNEKNSWQYGPEAHFACTIGNQFEILMLIERMELKGIHVISANTDGIVCLYKTDKQKDYDSVCKWWEETVGNAEQGKLEYARYEKMVQTSVNDYIAIKILEPGDNEADRIKKKGDFGTDYEIHKNKSRRIIPLALEQYYVNDIPVEETIMKHTNIFDFCIGVKSSANYHYKLINREGVERVYEGVVRYYISKDGDMLLKIKRENSEATGPKVSQAEAEDKNDERQWKCVVANSIDKEKTIQDYNIDYEYYIRKCQTIIQGIQNPKRKKTVIINKNQTTLF